MNKKTNQTILKPVLSRILSGLIKNVKRPSTNTKIPPLCKV